MWLQANGDTIFEENKTEEIIPETRLMEENEDYHNMNSESPISENDRFSNDINVKKISYPDIADEDSIIYPEPPTTSDKLKGSDENQLPAKTDFPNQNGNELEASVYFTPELSFTPPSYPKYSTSIYESLPNKPEILDQFQLWMESMDGGCHPSEISKKANYVIAKILDSINVNQLMDPETVCSYFTTKQLRKELTASSTNIYLRYFSAFMLFLHQNYKHTFNLEIYSNIEKRIER